MAEVLVIDDDPAVRLTLGGALREGGHAVTLASDGTEALTILAQRAFDVVITDMHMPGSDGLTVFRTVKRDSPDTDVILITAHGAVADAVTALKEGAQDYLTKPFEMDELLVRIKHIAEHRELKNALHAARRELDEHASRYAIIGKSPGILRLIERIETMAESDAPVLITGESGTGKELVARMLHAKSPRRNGPFVAVNCAAFPETLLEAELFGHERGAFTGAVKRRLGRFKSADKGTLFLDEVAEIPPTAQAKLLRVLQEGVLEPLGTNEPVRTDVRIISATHQNLKQRISEHLFREDLFYRLNVLDVSIPPLRERLGDLPILIEHFLRRHARDRAQPPAIEPRAWAALSEYSFPGNVRELEHAIEHAVVLARGGPIEIVHLPDTIARPAEGGVVRKVEALRPLSIAMKEFEREYLVRVLAATGGKRTRAAELLGISRKGLWEKLRAFGVSGDEEE
jgi:DNA-binding NtrC family response regulator